VAVTPDGRHLFTANSGSHDVTAFEVGGSGGLTLVGSFATGGRTPAAFRGVVVLPDQGPVAALTARVRGAGRESRFDASASTDSDGRVIRYDWDFGDGTVIRDAGAEVGHVDASAGRFAATVTVRDNEGCGARLVFTGQTALCNGSAAARDKIVVNVAPTNAGRT
jgi:DNA-binding beta-propeller fold protein YncE